MKISREQAEESLRYLRQAREGGAERSEQRRPREAPQVSPDEIAKVVSRFSDADECRQALVAELRRELEGNSYEVPSDWVAEKLVGRLVSDRLR